MQIEIQKPQKFEEDNILLGESFYPNINKKIESLEQYLPKKEKTIFSYDLNYNTWIRIKRDNIWYAIGIKDHLFLNDNISEEKKIIEILKFEKRFIFECNNIDKFFIIQPYQSICNIQLNELDFYNKYLKNV